MGLGLNRFNLEEDIKRLIALGGASAAVLLTGNQTKTGTLTVPVLDTGGLVVNAVSQGCVGDGATLNDTFIALGLAQIVAFGGGTLAFPAGTFLFTNIVCQASNIRMVGQGMGVTTLKQKNAANKIGILFSPVSGVLNNVGLQDLTLDGNGANQTIANGNTGSAAWIAEYGAGTPENTYSQVGIIFANCRNVNVTRVGTVNTLCGAINANNCDSVLIDGCRLVNSALIRSLQNAHYIVSANAISIIGTISSGTSTGFRVVNNDIEGVTDVGIDIHGNGTNYVAVTGNTVHDQIAGTANGASYWGIFLEMESADTIDNIGASITGNYVSNLNIAYGLNNNGDVSHTLYAATFTGNTATNCTTFFDGDGSYGTFTGNAGYKLGAGISLQNVSVNNLHARWLFSSNVMEIIGTAFGCSAFFLRTSATGLAFQDILISDNLCYGNGAAVSTHAGLYIDAAGTSSSITRVRAEGNLFLNFNDGMLVNSSVGTTTLVSLINNESRNNGEFGLNVLGGTHLRVEGGDLTGNTSGATSGMTTTKVDSIRNVKGYNDTLTTTPLTPGGSPYTTPVAFRDCSINVTGGTVSGITVGGVATGLTSGSFWVPAGKSLVITYSVAPTVTQVGY